MEYLLEFCDSDSQRAKVKAYVELGTVRKVAEELGVCHQNVSSTLRLLKKRAAARGIAPDGDMNHRTAEGFNVKGTTTLYKNGEQTLQWVKTEKDKANPQEVADAFNEMLADFKPIKLREPSEGVEDLLTVYPMGDPHIGMYAWAEEAGEDYDLEIGCRDLRKATKYLVQRSPNSKTALILNLGDFFHSDNSDNRTARSGNALDVDGRWAKVLRTGIDLMCELVVAALEKHENVIVKNIIGNHDDHSSIFIGLALEKFFKDEPRVKVDQSPAKFWYYQFGSVLIGSTHGDTAKPDKLPQIMAADKPKEWGSSDYRYWYTGHIHSRNVIEFSGCTWESFRTLAAKDAWHTGAGYRSLRDMTSITIHKDFGEIGRDTASIKMITSFKGEDKC